MSSFRSNDLWLAQCLGSLAPLVAQADQAPVGGLTVMVQRHEWDNLYHTLADIYNVFLAATFLGHHPREVDVVFADRHPLGRLHWLWVRAFLSAQSLAELPAQTYAKLAISRCNHQSPLTSCLGPKPPLLEQLSGHLRTPSSLPPNLVTVVSRAGCQQRTLENEDELVACLRRRLPEFDVRLQRLEDLELEEQLELMSRTALLVGSHGAGMAHCLFLPPSGAVLELFPGFLQAFRFHYSNISQWRGLPYSRWVNLTVGSPAVGKPVRVPAEKVADQAAKLMALRNRD